ncbi:putative DNA binding protein [Enterobacter phage EC151]|nr:putative DNA binding protein [Enterobacter phage EC151]
MAPEFDFNADEAQKATNEDIMEWLKVKSELAKVKAKEAILRDRIIKTFFTGPKEGTNTHELGNQYKLKYTHKLSREVDEAMLTNLLPALKEKEIDVDQLIERKPSLKIKNWRDLTEEQHQVFDQVITTKPASGSLEFVKPKGVE